MHAVVGERASRAHASEVSGPRRVSGAICGSREPWAGVESRSVVVGAKASRVALWHVGGGARPCLVAPCRGGGGAPMPRAVCGARQAHVRRRRRARAAVGQSADPSVRRSKVEVACPSANSMAVIPRDHTSAFAL